ncbi:MAG: DUF115 domain-containing protein [Treponema sp.]|jgi:hypothetical protein|nr:DUF115 domain-containing protein [Treponema sp.]
MTALHSRYNPQGEAERYLDALSISPAIRCFVLIEPGLGYMIPVLSRRFPGARIIVLHVSGDSANRVCRDSAGRSGANTVYWNPACGLPAEDFLARELEELTRDRNFGPDFGPQSIKIIEWRPSLDFYGDSCVKLLSAAAAAIRRFDAERRTLHAFGRRWFRNFLKNLRVLCRSPLVRDFRKTDAPILVTGSGPSLEESLPFIKKLAEGQNHFIIAASSSVMALLHRGIVPNLVLSTDGGGWAPLHLYELFRTSGPARKAANRGAFSLAVGFTASLPSQCGGLPALGIADGSLWQTLVLRGLGIPHLALPQRGTVTATALDLALALGRGKIIIAGMDLDSRDIRTHARPYGFDRLWREGASRFRSEYSQSFFRRMAAREGGSYRIYAEWFASRLGSYGGRLYTLGTNNPLFAGLPRLRDPAVPDSRGGPAAPAEGGPDFAWAPPRERREKTDAVSRALEILGAALENSGSRETITGELAPLILPGKPVPGAGELRAEMESLARPYLPAGNP